MSLPAPVATRTRPGAQQRGEDTRLRILRTALQVFATEGYEGASTRTLAERANVNLPALQYYFGNKEGLYRAVIDHIGEIVESRIAPVAEQIHAALAAGDVPRRQLIELLCRMLDAFVALVTDQTSPDWESRALFFARAEIEQQPALDTSAQAGHAADRRALRRADRPPDRSTTRYGANAVAHRCRDRTGNRVLQSQGAPGAGLEPTRGLHGSGPSRRWCASTPERSSVSSKGPRRDIVAPDRWRDRAAHSAVALGLRGRPRFPRPAAPEDAGYTPRTIAAAHRSTPRWRRGAALRARRGPVRASGGRCSIPSRSTSWWSARSRPIPISMPRRPRCARRNENVYAGEASLFPTRQRQLPSRSATRISGAEFGEPNLRRTLSASSPRSSTSPTRRMCSAARAGRSNRCRRRPSTSASSLKRPI